MFSYLSCLAISAGYATKEDCMIRLAMLADGVRDSIRLPMSRGPKGA